MAPRRGARYSRPMDSEDPPISVIMPTLDRARYIGQAIDSVLAQSRADFELIIVDDGSTDGTAELVAGIPDPRLRYIRQETRGIAAAMNTGLSAARGRYIARLDSDDLWLPRFLETLADLLDCAADVDIAYARGQVMDAGGHLLDHIHGGPMRFPGDALRSMVFDDFTCNIALLARRTCIDRVGGYDESLLASEDWDLWLRIARHSRVAFVDLVRAHIRWHSGNLTGVQSPAFAAVLGGRAVPLEKLFADPDLPADVSALRSLAYENVHLFCGTRWQTAGRWHHATREFCAALSVSDAPLRTAARIAWFSFNVSRLGRSPLGRRVTSRLRTSLTKWR